MRFFLLLLIAAILAGCAKTKSNAPDAQKNSRVQAVGTSSQKTEESAPVITPDQSLSGKVLFVNKNSKFVVVTFPGGRVPTASQRFSLYRDGLKVGEIRVTGPQEENNTVADIIVGDAQKNDEVREN